MENAKAKHIWHEFINRFELYIGCVLFLAMMVLLTIQVVTRYFGHAITWTEELSCIMLVWMSYLGFAGAITSRKHLRIDAFINSRPFKVKKVMLIISNIINGIFAALLISPMYNVVMTFHSIIAVSPIMRIPKAVSFSILPFSMVLIIIRTVQECLIGFHSTFLDSATTAIGAKVYIKIGNVTTDISFFVVDEWIIFHSESSVYTPSPIIAT